MKFKDFKYVRPSLDEFKEKMAKHIELIQKAESAHEQIEAVKEIHLYLTQIFTEVQVATVRHTIDTKDAFYETENEYWDEHMPLYAEWTNRLEKVLLASPYRKDLEEVFSKQYFDIMENADKTFSPEIMEEMQQENKLVSEYNKLVASAEIEFEGQTYNLSGLRPFMVSKDRDVRRRAGIAYFGFFEANEEAFDRIYNEMVKVRHQKATKLGFKNYVEFAYRMMNRNDYNQEMVEKFRKQVLKEIVPVANQLYDRQAKRLGVEKLASYDLDFEFETGNATPKGDADFILANAKKMYEELSPETHEFFSFMVENELMDLVTKPGKQAGGYCTIFTQYKAPFIFANFNGTSDDIDVMTHEAGHAFQVYQSRNIGIPNLEFPTYESAEIHSMSMEFITWPWMENFFKEETDKYKYVHLGSAIKFIPYGVIVDAFQHFVYEHPEATPAERKAYWRKLEKEYLPHKDYSECPFLEKGTWWYKQGHIYASPFYYIDYTLAQICSLQFWKKMQNDRASGWQDYLNICHVGGTKSFLQLVEQANLISPFEEGCVASIIKDIEDYLMAIDDTKL